MILKKWSLGDSGDILKTPIRYCAQTPIYKHHDFNVMKNKAAKTKKGKQLNRSKVVSTSIVPVRSELFVIPKPIELNTIINKWVFRCRLSERDSCAIKPWIKGLSKKALARLDRAIEQLAHQPPQNWCRPNASPMGNHLYVIRFSDENRKQHRIFGHFSDIKTLDASFVMSLDGYEKDDTYYPSNYEELSGNYRDWCNAAHTQRTIRCLYTSPASEDENDIVFHHECSSCIC